MTAQCLRNCLLLVYLTGKPSKMKSYNVVVHASSKIQYFYVQTIGSMFDHIKLSVNVYQSCLQPFLDV
jgi:hypothetical protein